MAEVFISYASEDRDRVLDIVKRLQTRSIDVWIDRYKIPGGSEWSSEIVRGIKSCTVLLLVTSRHALESKNVRKEIDLAASESKTILPLWIETQLTYPDSIAYHLKGIHYVVAEDDATAWLDRVFEALRRTGVKVAEHGDDGRLEQNASRSGITARTTLMPYLVDRAEQERRIALELENHIRHNVHRRLSSAACDASQFIDGFVNRLHRYTLPRHLALMKLPDQLEWKRIFWPKPEIGGGIEPGDDRVASYRIDVAVSLGLIASAQPDALVHRIADYRQPVVFTSIIDGEYWQPDEPKLIAQVLEFWSRLPDIKNGQPLLIFFAMLFRQSRPSLLARWFARRRNSEISDILPLVRKFKGGGVEASRSPSCWTSRWPSPALGARRDQPGRSGGRNPERQAGVQ